MRDFIQGINILAATSFTAAAGLQYFSGNEWQFSAFLALTFHFLSLRGPAP